MVFQPHTTSCPEVGCDANLQRDLSFGQQMNQFRIVSRSQRMPQTLGSDIQGAPDALRSDRFAGMYSQAQSRIPSFRIGISKQLGRAFALIASDADRSEEHTSELQSRENLV